MVAPRLKLEKLRLLNQKDWTTTIKIQFKGRKTHKGITGLIIINTTLKTEKLHRRNLMDWTLSTDPNHYYLTKTPNRILKNQRGSQKTTILHNRIYVKELLSLSIELVRKMTLPLEDWAAPTCLFQPWISILTKTIYKNIS